MQSLRKLPHLLIGLSLLGAALYATAGSSDKPTNTKVAFASTSAVRAPIARVPATERDADTYVFSATPGGTYEQEVAKYQPIAEHLSTVTGKRFVYQYSDNWLSYSKNMASGAYDVVFDGPAFNGWRVENINHTPLAKLPDDIVYVVVTRPETNIAQLKQLAGHRVCAVAPPDVGALAVLSQFDNPLRQPVISEARTWQEARKNMAAGKCTAAIMPQKSIETLDRNSLKVVYQHRALPNQAFSAGPRLSNELKAKVRDALLSATGKRATAALRSAHGGADLIPASPGEYAGLGKLLKDSLYYY